MAQRERCATVCSTGRLNNSRAKLVWAVCVAGIPPPMIERGLSCSVLESWFILEVRIETNGAYIAPPCKINAWLTFFAELCGYGGG